MSTFKDASNPPSVVDSRRNLTTLYRIYTNAPLIVSVLLLLTFMTGQPSHAQDELTLPDESPFTGSGVRASRYGRAVLHDLIARAIYWRRSR
ncbi:MAG: hypothetical protein U0528_04425 [Anaerolineae bacterium]